MSEKHWIEAIVINGRHGGYRVEMPYSPTINLPIEKESQISIGEKYDESMKIGDTITYYECFRSVDKRCVLYSTSGSHEDVNYLFFKQTYPIRLY